MAINFNQNSVWNLKPIGVDSVRDETVYRHQSVRRHEGQPDQHTERAI